MNFNANAGPRQSLGRKVKRVSDVNAMGYNPYNQPQTTPFQQPTEDMYGSNNAYYAGFSTLNAQQPQQEFTAPTPGMPGNYPPNAPFVPQQMGNVFAQPIVQDMAFQYGQQLANTGKSMLQQGVDQYVPVTKLKYYFAVDTKYVITKLSLLFFPFIHSDWAVKYEQDGNPVQPRFEINAPDLYIPTMAYFTYVLVAGLVLGMQQRFTPEQIVIPASSALAWCLIELVIYSATLYITNIETSLKTLDLLAFSGYKFVGIIASILVSIVAKRTGYYLTLAYVNFSLAFFLIRTLKIQVLPEKHAQYYGGEVPASGNKRRLYFLLFIAAIQPVLSWWLSYHLIATSPLTAS